MARNLTGRIATGGLIVLVGVLLLLATTDALPADSIWDWVPAIFVVLGLWALLSSGFRNLTGPVMVIAIAGTYLARNVGVIGDEAIGTWWPLFVVLFGVLLLIGRQRRGHGRTATDANDELNAIALFGGADRRLTTDRFVGGEVIVAFGGAEIDLRDAEIDQPPATIEAVVLFGGAEIRVPEEWSVDLDVLPLFGGASDERSRPADDGTARRSEKSDLVLTGVALFGGVEVSD
ncbi:cell wall-active antibiotics response protein [Salinarchaeum laminariae]|uniref:cell wall-active antibiotics response protein n=1 Tax=Salinarchaeum laminariae TaxID=869888 RepID=UPI0020C0E3BE|nr:cell wall-active antibiotics response protein [Salinarchaeum laminariae]